MLVYLVERAGRLVTRDELLNALWPDTFVQPDVLKTHMLDIRGALGDDAKAPTFIETLPRRGYRFIATIRKSANAGSEPREGASIAVLPFVNLGPEKENDYFGDGLAEDIINELTKIPGLKVIARTSAFAFKGRAQDIRRIAEMLGVSNILEGSFRYAGSRLRINAQLITAADGSHLWSGRFDRDASDILNIQDEIAQAIANALQAQLRGPGERRPSNSEAYQGYLEGRYWVQHVTPQGIERALECYRRAIELDPTYALPYSGLALQAYYRVLYLAEPSREVVPAALAALGRALELDPGSAQSHTVRGVFSAFYEYNWKAAEQHFAKALEMDPSSPMVRVGHVLWFLLPTLRLEEALNDIRQAVMFDPLSPIVRVTELWVLYTMKRPEAADAARRLIQIFPSLPICRYAAGLALMRCDFVAEAAAAAEDGLKIVPNDVFLLGILGLARTRQGRIGEAEQIRATLEERSKTRHTPFLARAYGAEACGDADSASKLWSQAIEEREPLAVITLADRRNDPAHQSRYRSLFAKMNLA